jgi:hypothetical protein
MYEMNRWLLVYLAIIRFPLGVLAGPPILADDTGASWLGKGETNVGFTVEKRQDATRFETPAFYVNYECEDQQGVNYRQIISGYAILSFNMQRNE